MKANLLMNLFELQFEACESYELLLVSTFFIGYFGPSICMELYTVFSLNIGHLED